MAAAARGAGLVFFDNPSNPAATLHPATAVTAFVERIRQRFARHRRPDRRGLSRLRDRSAPQDPDPDGARDAERDRRAHVLQGLRHGRPPRWLRASGGPTRSRRCASWLYGRARTCSAWRPRSPRSPMRPVFSRKPSGTPPPGSSRSTGSRRTATSPPTRSATSSSSTSSVRRRSSATPAANRMSSSAATSRRSRSRTCASRSARWTR